MHHWNDDWPYWNDLNEAVDLIDRLMRFGRLGHNIKEKYGTIRCSISWANSLHALIWPSYVYRQWPNNWLGDKLWWMDIYFWPRVFKYTGFGWFLFQWQKFVYGASYRIAVKKYPHIADEILSDADHYELISQQAIDIHHKYWKRIT